MAPPYTHAMSALPESLRVIDRSHALRLVFRLLWLRRSRDLYSLISQLFDILTDGSGIFALGFVEPDADPGSIDLVAGQRALVAEVGRGLPEQGRWVDAGCGLGGPALQLLAERPEVDLTGLNITPEQVAAANDAAALAGLADRARFLEADIQAMPLDSDAYDALFAIEAAFHCPRRDDFFAEAARVLKPGAQLVVSDFAAADPPLGGLEGLALNFGLWVAATPRLWGFERWAASARAAGFEEVEVVDMTGRIRPALRGWAARMRERRATLGQAYPVAFLDAYREGIEAMLERPTLPFRYLVLRARAPGEARETEPAPESPRNTT